MCENKTNKEKNVCKVNLRNNNLIIGNRLILSPFNITLLTIYNGWIYMWLNSLVLHSEDLEYETKSQIFLKGYILQIPQDPETVVRLLPSQQHPALPLAH